MAGWQCAKGGVRYDRKICCALLSCVCFQCADAQTRIGFVMRVDEESSMLYAEMSICESGFLSAFCMYIQMITHELKVCLSVCA